MALDRNFIPMNMTSRRKSLRALIAGKAQILDLRTMQRYDFSAEALVMHFDAIVYPNTQAVPVARAGMGGDPKAILRRDSHICQYGTCIRRANTVDHVLPRCQGGKSTWGNLVACCFECNQAKGPHTPEQAGMKLKRKPTSPRESLIRKFQDMLHRAAA
jgi:hypothetical protein